MPTTIHAITENPFGDNTLAVYKKKIVLTQEQILSLPTTPIDVIQGLSGKVIHFISGCINLIKSNEAYGNINVGILYLQYSLSGSGITNTSDFSAMQANQRYYSPLSSIVINSANTVFASEFECEGAGIQIAAANGGTDFTGGDPADVLEVTVFYSILDL